MAWVRLEANQQRVRQALLAGYGDEAVVCRTNYFDQLAAAVEELDYWDHLDWIQMAWDKDGDDVPHRDDLYNALRAVPVARREDFRRAHTQAVFEHLGVTGHSRAGCLFRRGLL